MARALSWREVLGLVDVRGQGGAGLILALFEPRGGDPRWARQGDRQAVTFGQAEAGRRCLSMLIGMLVVELAAWSNAPWLRSIESSFDGMVDLLAAPELVQDATQPQDVSCVDQHRQQEQQEQGWPHAGAAHHQQNYFEQEQEQEEVTQDYHEPYAFYCPAPYEYAPSAKPAPAPSPRSSSAPSLAPPVTPRCGKASSCSSGSKWRKRANSDQVSESGESLCSATSMSSPPKRARSRGELPSNVALLEHVALTLERVGKSGRRWEPCAKAWNKVVGEGHQMSPDNLKMSVKRLLQERKSRTIASQWDALGRAGSLSEVQSVLGTAFAPLGPSWPVAEMAAFLWDDLERPRRNYCNLASWPADVRELIEAAAVRLHLAARPLCACSRRSGPLLRSSCCSRAAATAPCAGPGSPPPACAVHATRRSRSSSQGARLASWHLRCASWAAAATPASTAATGKAS
jgi:hypothetical protein